MTRQEATTLKIGDRVRFRSPKADSTGNTTIGGVVTGALERCITVEWDDGQEGATHPADMAMFEREAVRS